MDNISASANFDTTTTGHVSMKRLLIFWLIATSTHAAALPEHFMTTDKLTDIEMACYANAMIGYDSVVNAHAGLKPEASLSMIQGDDIVPLSDPRSNQSTLSTAMSAYLWTGPAHTYAIKTFAKCITEQSKGNK